MLERSAEGTNVRVQLNLLVFDCEADGSGAALDLAGASRDGQELGVYEAGEGNRRVLVESHRPRQQAAAVAWVDRGVYQASDFLFAFAALPLLIQRDVNELDGGV